MYANSAEDVILVDVSSADVTLAKEAYAVRAAGAGNIVLLTRAGNKVTMAFTAGETRYVATGQFFHASTTATGIEAMISTFAIAPNVISGEVGAVEGSVTGDNTGSPTAPPGQDGSSANTDSPTTTT